MISFSRELSELARAVTNAEAARQNEQVRQSAIIQRRIATQKQHRAIRAAKTNAPAEAAILQAMHELQALGEKPTRRAISDHSGLTLCKTHHHMARMEDDGLIVQAGLHQKSIVYKAVTPVKKAA